MSKQQRPDASEVRAIMDSAVDAIVTADERGVIRSFNRAAERLFGFSKQEAVGQPISLLMLALIRAVADLQCTYRDPVSGLPVPRHVFPRA